MTSRASAIASWCFTVIAVTLAVLPGLLFRRAEYDPIVALTMLTVVGVVWYTYFTRQALRVPAALNDEKNDKLRRAIATAVLFELAGVTERLKTVVANGPSGQPDDFLRHPFLDAAAANLALFSPETIQSLTQAFHRLEDVRLGLARYERVEYEQDQARARGAPQAASLQEKKKELDGWCRTRSAWAFNRMAELVAHLTKEGGDMPKAFGEVPHFGETTPSLVPDPFGR
jgi:hypothetical protein